MFFILKFANPFHEASGIRGIGPALKKKANTPAMKHIKSGCKIFFVLSCSIHHIIKQPEQMVKQPTAGSRYLSVIKKRTTHRTLEIVKVIKIKFFFQFLNITRRPAIPTGTIKPNFTKANFRTGIILSIR